MNEQKQESFMDYWRRVDAAITKRFGVNSDILEVDPAEVAKAQENRETPDAFAKWFGQKHDMPSLHELRAPMHDIIERLRGNVFEECPTEFQKERPRNTPEPSEGLER